MRVAASFVFAVAALISTSAQSSLYADATGPGSVAAANLAVLGVLTDVSSSAIFQVAMTCQRLVHSRFASVMSQYQLSVKTRPCAGMYSSVLHYLKAVEALKSDANGKATVAKMKEMPTDDALFGKGYIRADGRKIHSAYLFEVKKPEDSKYPGDEIGRAHV